jgi:hypothetical protein
MAELVTMLSNGKGLWFAHCKHCVCPSPPHIGKDALRVLARAKEDGWTCIRRPKGDFYAVCPRCMRLYARIAGQGAGKNSGNA